MDNRNLKIARELVRLANELVAMDRTAKWDWRHPFTFNGEKQDINELAKNIKEGVIKDVILVRLDSYENLGPSKSNQGYDNILIKGKIISPKKVKVSGKDLKWHGDDGEIQIETLSHRRNKKLRFNPMHQMKEYGYYKVVWGSTNSSLIKELDNANESFQKFKEDPKRLLFTPFF